MVNKAQVEKPFENNGSSVQYLGVVSRTQREL